MAVVAVSNFPKHPKRKISDWNPFLAADIVSVDNFNGCLVKVFQTVENDFYPAAPELGKSVYNGLIGTQDKSVAFRQRNT